MIIIFKKTRKSYWRERLEIQNANYHTGQREALAECLKRNNANALTAGEISADLEKNGYKIGMATIYRNLEAMAKNGAIHKFIGEDGKKARWQFVNCQSKCTEHYHLKCENCGKIIHMECNSILNIEKHILQEHNFCINRSHTILYGLCNACANV